MKNKTDKYIKQQLEGAKRLKRIAEEEIKEFEEMLNEVKGG